MLDIVQMLIFLCSVWVVGWCLTKLKAEHKIKCNQIATASKRKYKEKVPVWSDFLQENFGEIVVGDVSQWANRRICIYVTYKEEDVQLAHMDFTTAYSMLTFSVSDRKKWLLIAKEKLLTHAMLLNKGSVGVVCALCSHHICALHATHKLHTCTALSTVPRMHTHTYAHAVNSYYHILQSYTHNSL